MLKSVTFKLTNKIKVTAAALTILTMFLTLVNPFATTEIIVLNRLTERNDGVINQICLVKNPPKSSDALVVLIDEFNLKTSGRKNNFHRLFLKEHDKIWFPALTLSENVDYTSQNTTRHDLDNIDFLATSYNGFNFAGNRIKETKCYTGKRWYYKE